MRFPRLTLAALMLLVLWCGLAMVALSRVSEDWAAVLLTLTLGALGIAILGSRFAVPRSRPMWIGFAVFSGGYLLLAFGPWFATEVEPRLATSRVLDALFARVFPNVYAGDPPVDDASYLRHVWSDVYGTPLPDDEVRSFVEDRDPLKRAKLAGRLLAKRAPTPSELQSPTGSWGLWTPVASLEQFRRTGHSLFAVVAGFCGALIAFWFQRSAISRNTATAATIDADPDTRRPRES